MRRLQRRQPRGFTLIELMMSVGIVAVAVASAGSLLIAGGKMTRNGQEYADANDASRIAGEAVVVHAWAAGMGAPGGLWVVNAGTPARVSPVYGLDSSVAPDELWLVVPHRNALREACVDVGAATSVVTAGVGELEVDCVGGLGGFPLLMASNMSTGALLSNPVLTTTTTGKINYDESTTGGFSNAPERGGFQRGDIVFPVTVFHYFVAPSPTGPNLVRAVAQVNAGAGGPFADTASVEIVQRGVEDFQVAFGVDPNDRGNPDDIAYQNGFGPAYAPGLRSLRISIVAVSARTILDDENRPLLTQEYAPMTVENHVPGLPGDGRRRTLYSRRVELLNMAPFNL